MVLFPNLQSPKVDNELLNTRRFLMLYQYFAQIKGTNLFKMSFGRTPRNYNRLLRRHASRWSDTYHVEVTTVDPQGALDDNGLCVPIIETQMRTNVFNPNLQKELLSDHNMKCKLKLQEWYKLLADKRSLMTIIYGQCDEATRTKIALSD